MAYKRDPKLLEALVEKAIQQEEIQRSLGPSGYTKEFLTSKLKRKSGEIWDTAQSQIAQFDSLENEHGQATSRLSLAVPPLPQYLRIIRAVRTMSIVVALIVVAANIVLRLNVGSLKLALWLSPWRTLLLGIFPYALLVAVLLFILVRFLNQMYERLKAKVRLAEENSLRIGKLEDDLKAAKTRVEDYIYRGILERLRIIIDSQLDPSYETVLPILDAPGLAETFDLNNAIDTSAKDRLTFMFNTMPGGSIGIACPRDTGKTTLMWSFLRGGGTSVKGLPVLPVMVSAPVQYEPRDFILNLFSAACYQTLEVEGVNDARKVWKESAWDEAEELRPRVRSSSLAPFLARIGKYTFPAGVLFITVALSTAFLLLNESRAPSTSQSQNPTTQNAPAPNYEVGLTSYIRSLGVSPADFFKWGLLLLVVSFASSYFDRYLYGRIDEKNSRYPSYLPHDSSLARNAYDRLREIKFQQSFTSGWSGSLKTPVGLEAGISGAVTVAKMQLGLPEIVESFHDFLRSVSVRYQIIIGIDELDKLESDEEAQRFLNEIKSIFGLESCFFLISVSESAMSNFERRGLPFRDAFDSAFDNIVYVDYLDLNKAKLLLARRIIGLPVPFLEFCYCVSGGLPRDLIRACRNILEFAQGITGKDLGSICHEMVCTDLKMKIQAAALKAKQLPWGPDVTSFIEKLYKIERITSLSSQDMLEAYVDFSTELILKPSGAEFEATLERHEKLESLRKEMAAYIYHLATILGFFGESSDKTIFKTVEQNGVLESLTQARQALTIDPHISTSLIDEFRRANSMRIPDRAPLRQP
jgi:hypothetical protein